MPNNDGRGPQGNGPKRGSDQGKPAPRRDGSGRGTGQSGRGRGRGR